MYEKFSKSWFENLESKLRTKKLDGDEKSFDEIKEILKTHKTLSPDEFATSVIYIILTAGHNQKAAKTLHIKLMERITGNQSKEKLLQVFGNHKKIDAILNVWNNRETLSKGYYNCTSLDEKTKFLLALPCLGKGTVRHLTRNLGENTFGYSKPIQQLAVQYSKNPKLEEKVRAVNPGPEIRQACDKMFAHMEKETGLPVGYIDVVLAIAEQNHLTD